MCPHNYKLCIIDFKVSIGVVCDGRFVWLYDMRLLMVDQIGFGRDLLVLVSIDV